MSISNKELAEILEKHKHWLNGDCDGWEDMRRADLSEADLHGANLSEADLRRADLYGADLRRADLYGADLRRADLSEADLRRADLYGADLREADLRRADLYGADLSEADLRRADLYGADLRRADLHGANLSEADLRRADLYGTKNIPFITYTCPDTGSFIGYKKARHAYIIELEILPDAKRCSATGRKCRCDKAKVLRILNKDRTEADIKEVPSCYDGNFVYEVGKIVQVNDFEEDRWKECAPGIHFFINFEEAVEYQN